MHNFVRLFFSLFDEFANIRPTIRGVGVKLKICSKNRTIHQLNLSTTSLTNWAVGACLMPRWRCWHHVSVISIRSFLMLTSSTIPPHCWALILPPVRDSSSHVPAVAACLRATKRISRPGVVGQGRQSHRQFHRRSLYSITMNVSCRPMHLLVCLKRQD